MTTADLWTEEEWSSFIQEKVDQVLSNLDSPTSPLADLTSASDRRFPLTIDHTLLKQDATPDQIDALCDEAIKYDFKSCCVNGIFVPQVAKRLEGTETIACSVVGFPLGAGTAASQAFEALNAVANGAKEIDTVIPLSLLLSKPPHYRALYQHLRTIVNALTPTSTPLKVILETSLIPSNELKVAASVVAAEAGAAFVKTSTGFAGGGATADDVKLMAASVRYKGGVKVKASGGVRTFEKCREMFEAGAERIGTSSGAAIMRGLESAAGTY
ncbi:hypothetical protein CVT24_005882 [Panaeolus cyanescens]|uniref:deoxyribose-phosphate aldolase n=1 Tax=Panaeolus cyanescens TaxID=181874 RepID=A0A409YEW7_9AGAR|nr:hypothetical protein CVT24_005882 [Panaeolus cyanescens]